MVQGAVYDAVNAIDGGYQPYLVQPPSNPYGLEGGGRGNAAFACSWVLMICPACSRGSSRRCSRSLRRLHSTAVPDDPPGSKAAGAAPSARPTASGDARRAGERRPLRPPPDLVRRHDAGRLAADAAILRSTTPRRGSATCCRSSSRARRCSAPTGRIALTSAAYARGLQRGEGARLAHEHDPNRRSRPTRRSSGRTMLAPSGTGSSAR